VSSLAHGKTGRQDRPHHRRFDRHWRRDRETFSVIVTGSKPATVAAAQKELGPHALAVVSDASKLSDITALMHTVKSKYGRIDILFANAGIAQFAPLSEVTETSFDLQFNSM
jgi:NAD(P)-dependent dehydrogenase (short-subunit alcohol dehydrogenase family)